MNNIGDMFLRYMLLLTTVFGLYFVSIAQDGKYGATADDSVTCVENLSVYKDFYREKNYDKAMVHLRRAIAVCPGSSLKMYVDAENILKKLIDDNEKNPARANELIDTMFLFYDMRIQNFGNEGYVLGKKGAAMYKYQRPSLEEAYNTLKKSVDLDGNDAQAAAVIYYFQAAVKVHETQPKSPEFWVEMFNQCVTICDYNITSSRDMRKIESYTTALDNIVKLADPFLNCEIIVKFYSQKYEAQKENLSWLEGAAKLMEDKNCTDDPLFVKIATQMHTLNPSATSARSLGIMSIRSAKYNDGVKYLIQAIDLADDATDDANLDATLADLEILLAKAYYGAKDFVSARSHAMKATTFKSGWGEPYMLIGDMYAGSVATCQDDKDGVLKSPYWVAVDMYAKAKSVDPSVATDASQKIAKYSQYFPSTQDAFFHGITDGMDYTVKCWINTVTKARLR